MTLRRHLFTSRVQHADTRSYVYRAWHQHRTAHTRCHYRMHHSAVCYIYFMYSMYTWVIPTRLLYTPFPSFLCQLTQHVKLFMCIMACLSLSTITFFIARLSYITWFFHYPHSGSSIHAYHTCTNISVFTTYTHTHTPLLVG